MEGIENVYYQRKLIGIVFRKNIPLSGVKFFTKKDNPFQIGFHQREKGVSLNPHIHHLANPLIIDQIQEILFVLRGKIRVNFYSATGKPITEKILSTDDSVLLMDEGHGVDFLENSRVFEVKQGPYPGSKKAKIYFQDI